MDSEISIVGLCSFINLRNLDPNIIQATLIVPRTRASDFPDPSEIHVPFIAYDSTLVQTDAEGFYPVEDTHFFKRILESVRIEFPEDRSGTPLMLPSFGAIASAERYWPRSRSCKWNPKYVPGRYGTPDPDSVVAFASLGYGRLSADRLSGIRWEFNDAVTGDDLVDGFATRAIYSFPLVERSVTVRLSTPGNRTPTDLTFTPIDEGLKSLPVWIGNCAESYLARMLLGHEPAVHKPGTHFKILHRKKDPSDGPIPVPVLEVDPMANIALDELYVKQVNGRWMAVDREELEDKGRGDSGLCGPENGGPG